MSVVEAIDSASERPRLNKLSTDRKGCSGCRGCVCRYCELDAWNMLLLYSDCSCEFTSKPSDCSRRGTVV